MKNFELHYQPGDKVWIRGQYRECIIDFIVIDQNDITYNWYNLDVGVDITEVYDDGYFTVEDIGKSVFNSLKEYEEYYPEDFEYPEYDGDESYF